MTAHGCPVGATTALCPRGRAATAQSRVGGTTVVPCHCAGATLAHCSLGGATVAHCPGGCATTEYCHVGLHFWPREGSWTVGGRGGPGLTQGRRTEDHDASRRTSRVAVRVGNPSHSYHSEGFYTGARSPVGTVGVGTLAMHCPTSWGQWAVELL